MTEGGEAMLSISKRRSPGNRLDGDSMVDQCASVATRIEGPSLQNGQYKRNWSSCTVKGRGPVTKPSEIWAESG